jgi:hypothetical protein
MEEQEKQVEEVVEEKADEVVEEQPVLEETAEEKETEREKNLKAENARKQAEIERLRMEMEQRSMPKEQQTPEEIIRRMDDREIIACLASQQYADNHALMRDVLDERKFNRYQRRQEEQRAKLDSEIERQKNFPETFNATHPMAIKMTELMYQYRLENNPAGRLLAAKLASSELSKVKAVAAGRKQEQNRQADVKANFQGEVGRSAPKVSDTVKVEELKKRALAGDENARLEWMRYRAKTGGL